MVPQGLSLGNMALPWEKKKKRKTLTPARRIYIWERPKLYGRKCNICGQTIKTLSDLELDHTRAYSKGGTTLALAHRSCNRLKASGGLRQIQKQLGIKGKPKRRKPRARKRRRSGNSLYNALTRL